MSKARLHRRLDRVASVLAPVATTDCGAALEGSQRDEAPELALELAQAFGTLVSQYRQHYGLSPEEARARAADTPDHYFEHTLTCPASQVSWFDLGAVAHRDAARAEARWEEVKEAARGEVRAGHRAARVLEGFDSHCWRRAQFLAIRSELSAAWRPRNPAEQHLIDQMAQWLDLTWRWVETMTAYHGLMVNSSPRANKPDGEVELPRLSHAETMERAARMVERFHALYLQSLRALRDLRRLPPVVVRAAGQVNIADQQVNLTGAFGSNRGLT